MSKKIVMAVASNAVEASLFLDDSYLLQPAHGGLEELTSAVDDHLLRPLPNDANDFRFQVC